MKDDPAGAAPAILLPSDGAPARPHAPPPAPPPARPPSGAALKGAAARLSGVLERETAALRQRRPVDFAEFSDRKNQALLELTRLGQGLEPEALDPDLRSALRDLRDRLDENRSVLGLHLRAVRDVAEILATAIREAESDGTYSAASAGT